MSCTGCETAGLYGLSDRTAPAGFVALQAWHPPDLTAQPQLDSDTLFPLGPMEVELSQPQREALEQATGAAAGQGLEGPYYNAITPSGPYQSGTQQLSGMSGYAGSQGTKGRAQQYQASVYEMEQGGFSESEVTFPFGWRFTNDAGSSRDPSAPEEIYVIPLNFSAQETDGNCSTASGSDCSSGGTACKATIVYVLEVHSVVNAPARAKRPNPQAPTTLTTTDPNGVTSGISTSTASTGFYVSSETDPRGKPLSDANAEAYVSTSTVELSVTITSTGCGKWGVWKTNFRDWTLQFAGFTQQNDSRGNVPDEDMHWGVYCMPCKPTVQPGGGGQQGTGKNQDSNSIGQGQ